MRFHRHIAAAGLLGLSFLITGCANERHEDIPPSATMVSEGDEKLAFQAPRDGEIYVYDAYGTLVWSETSRRLGSSRAPTNVTLPLGPESV